MSGLRIELTRDSVCAGDDCDAPHAERFTLPSPLPLLETLGLIKASRYLASIAGGRATWVAILDGEPIGVVAQQWDSPRIYPGCETRPIRDGARLDFAYRAQEDPEETFLRRRGGR